MLLLQRAISKAKRTRNLYYNFSCYSTNSSGPLNILFFGRDDFSCKTLEQLWQAKDVWSSINTVTTEDDWIGRRRSELSVSPLKILGLSLGAPVHEVPKDDTEFQIPPLFSEPQFNNVLISASYGKAVSNTILSKFEHRLNVHPSLIPKYRGAAPIQWTIANGDTTTGVSIIRMEDVSQGFDTGDIYASTKMDVPSSPTYPTLAPILAQKGGILLAEVLRKLIRGEAVRTPQDSAKASKARIIRPGMFQVDWTKEASEIERWHRAVGHQRPLWTSFVPFGRRTESKKLKLLAMEVVEEPQKLGRGPGSCSWSKELGSLIVECGNNTALAVQTVMPQGKSAITAKDWWNGVHGDVVNFHRTE